MRVTAGGWLFVLCTSAVSAGQFSGPVRLEVHTEARSVTVAGYRLQRYLDTQNCTAELVFNQAGDGDLVYRQEGLAITWQGEPVSGAGWYAGTDTTNPGLQPCLKALLELKRSDDRQIFNLFPEWVYGFASPDSLQ